MKAFIFTGGDLYPDGVTERPDTDALTVAADAGYRTAEALGIRPALLIGDFDSLGEVPADTPAEIIRVPAKKNETDTQLAVRTALERGADGITVIGGFGGRLDHTLSNLAILEELDRRKIPAVMTDGRNRARFLRNGSLLLPRSPHFRYFSIVAADPVVKGVTAEGCSYPLTGATLSRLNQYAVSNEITGNCALIAVRRGGVWVIESADSFS